MLQRIKKSARSLCAALLLFAVLTSVTSQLGMMPTVPVAHAQTIVSRIATSSTGKTYLEVDGKPYLYLSVENWGEQQTLGDALNPGGTDWRYNTGLFSTPLPQDWLQNVFEKTRAAGYNTISIILKWS